MTSPAQPDAAVRQSPAASWRTAVGAMLCMIGASVPLSGASFFHPYLFAVMGGPGGAAQSEILLYFTLLMLGIVVSMSLLGKTLLPRLGAKPLMLAGAVIMAISLLLFARADSPAGLYLAGIVLGLGYGFSFQLIPMVWVNNWFRKHKGMAVGLVTGGTGLGGMLWAVLVPAVGGTPAPGNHSYRLAYLIMAGLVVVLAFVGTLVLARHETPAQEGLAPLGAAETRYGADGRALEPERQPGFTYAEAMRTPWLWMLVVGLVLMGVVHGGAQIMAPYLSMRVTEQPPQGMGRTAAYYSLAMSVWTVGLVAVKFLIGYLNDRIGVFGALALGLVLQAAFFVFLPHYHQVGLVLPLIAMLLMSAGMATGTVQPPMVTGRALGDVDFARIYSFTGATYIFGLAIGAPIWGLFYDPATRSYDLGFHLVPVVLAAVLALVFLALRGGRRQHLEAHRPVGS